MDIIEFMKLDAPVYPKLSIGYRWLYYDHGCWIVTEQKYKRKTHEVYHTTNLEDAIDVLIEEEIDGHQ